MSSFIAIADTTVSAHPANATIVRNDGWFPDIDLKDLREAMRLDGTVTLERVAPSHSRCDREHQR
jgi:hypothetical protein